MAGSLLGMRAFYALNIVGAGSSALELLLPRAKAAVERSWGAPVTPVLAASMIGSMWAAAAVVSVAGLMAPVTWSPVLAFQALYKAILTVKSTIPALLRRSKPADDAAIKIGAIFSTYVFILPFFIPWDHLLGRK